MDGKNVRKHLVTRWLLALCVVLLILIVELCVHETAQRRAEQLAESYVAPTEGAREMEAETVGVVPGSPVLSRDEVESVHSASEIVVPAWSFSSLLTGWWRAAPSSEEGVVTPQVEPIENEKQPTPEKQPPLHVKEENMLPHTAQKQQPTLQQQCLCKEQQSAAESWKDKFLSSKEHCDKMKDEYRTEQATSRAMEVELRAQLSALQSTTNNAMSSTLNCTADRQQLNELLQTCREACIADQQTRWVQQLRQEQVSWQAAANDAATAAQNRLAEECEGRVDALSQRCRQALEQQAIDGQPSLLVQLRAFLVGAVLTFIGVLCYRPAGLRRPIDQTARSQDIVNPPAAAESVNTALIDDLEVSSCSDTPPPAHNDDHVVCMAVQLMVSLYEAYGATELTAAREAIESASTAPTASDRHGTAGWVFDGTSPIRSANDTAESILTPPPVHATAALCGEGGEVVPSQLYDDDSQFVDWLAGVCKQQHELLVKEKELHFYSVARESLAAASDRHRSKLEQARVQERNERETSRAAEQHNAAIQKLKAQLRQSQDDASKEDSENSKQRIAQAERLQQQQQYWEAKYQAAVNERESLARAHADTKNELSSADIQLRALQHELSLAQKENTVSHQKHTETLNSLEHAKKRIEEEQQRRESVRSAFVQVSPEVSDAANAPRTPSPSSSDTEEEEEEDTNVVDSNNEGGSQSMPPPTPMRRSSSTETPAPPSAAEGPSEVSSHSGMQHWGLESRGESILRELLIQENKQKHMAQLELRLLRMNNARNGGGDNSLLGVEASRISGGGDLSSIAEDRDVFDNYGGGVSRQIPRRTTSSGIQPTLQRPPDPELFRDNFTDEAENGASLRSAHSPPGSSTSTSPSDRTTRAAAATTRPVLRR